jgi:hypothetical protein
MTTFPLRDFTPSFHFPFLNLFLPLPAMDDKAPDSSVPRPMEHVPPDPPPPPTHGRPSALHLHQSPPPLVPLPISTQFTPPVTHVLQDNQELIQALQALQVACARAPPSSSQGPKTLEEPDLPKLLLMVADQSQNPRTTPEAVARADLTNLWRGRLLSLDQVTDNLFLAAFRSEADMMAIIRGQPWTLRNNNLLLEMYVQGRATRDYAFQFLEATVKLFGIPSMFRTEHHINAIINLIGHPSDWHRINPRTFTADPYFVAVKVKLDATKSVLDKIFYKVPPVGNLGAIVIWVHYEKIKRICTFCAKLFHNAEQCPDRVQRIMAAGEDINFDQYGL